ncbi:uncharacterized protein B0I36DRAFT_354395 [Microdochium trichocladiopsis]|uniref:Uncharacterized protein n=1 Tax=Microdochium trichocladiopsis TaxID=1682393 RepID=A0A9P8XW34_9PEZI|nr:uncharacterized protein B0I36DRAFT_354395 [Microdochium trichocladiopsis]KAH7018079.1 hypothetical protein B0I36DRAFT_354395 [Microdochium trichocladiopsis]
MATTKTPYHYFQSQIGSPLFRLPPELRIKIYRDVLLKHESTVDPWPIFITQDHRNNHSTILRHTELLQSCKKVHAEAGPDAYRHICLKLTDAWKSRLRLEQLAYGSNILANIQTVAMEPGFVTDLEKEDWMAVIAILTKKATSLRSLTITFTDAVGHRECDLDRSPELLQRLCLLAAVEAHMNNGNSCPEPSKSELASMIPVSPLGADLAFVWALSRMTQLSKVDLRGFCGIKWYSFLSSEMGPATEVIGHGAMVYRALKAQGGPNMEDRASRHLYRFWAKTKDLDPSVVGLTDRDTEEIDVHK